MGRGPGRSTSAGAARLASSERPDDASQRQLMKRAATIGLLMRQTVNLVVASIALGDPASTARSIGWWLLVVLAAWSLYRLATRSHRPVVYAVDLVLVLAVCVAMPHLVQDPVFHSYNTAPQAIAGTAVVSFSVSVSARVSLPITLAIAAAYAFGGGMVAGWDRLGDITALYYFALQWGTAALIRLMLTRVAFEVDRARAERQAAELNQQVTEAVREYEREQLALLHDTAASTLLMVGQGAAVSPARLAAQARRDLELLREGPWDAPPERLELVSGLEAAAEHLLTPIVFCGTPEVWLRGDLTRAVVAAFREALNNVDRHAQATRLTVNVGPNAVQLRDDGVGFDLERPRSGRGVADSIIGRMTRAGGGAEIISTPGAGTLVQLSWSTDKAGGDTVEPPDPDRMIDKVRLRYGLALTVYAIANIAASAQVVLQQSSRPDAETVLLTAAALAALGALPGILRQRWFLFSPVALTLMVVTVVQSMIVEAGDLGGQAHWVQNAIGWCVLPTALALPTRLGAAALMFYWTVSAAVQLARAPDAETLVNLGLGTASILAVQLFALVFNGLMRDAALDAQRENDAHLRLRRRERVAQALRAEYQRRYAKLVDNVMPLLRAMSQGDDIDDQLRRQARAESRRLRALFDQAATFDNPLMRSLRPLIDTAESHQLDLVVEMAGELPDLDADAIGCLTAPLALVLGVEMTSARLVVTVDPGEVSLSVVCHGVTGELPLALADTAVVDVVTGEDPLWVLIRHRVEKEVEARVSAPVGC